VDFDTFTSHLDGGPVDGVERHTVNLGRDGPANLYFSQVVTWQAVTIGPLPHDVRVAVPAFQVNGMP